MSLRSSAARKGMVPQRILVRAPNWLGDVVMATPGLRRLRHAYPEAHIVVQLPAPLIPLLAGNAACDEIWPLASRGGGLGGWRVDVERIRAGAFDLGIALPESVSSALLMRLGGVGRVVGFARDAARRALLHDVIKAPDAWGRRRLISRERFALHLMECVIGLGTETPVGVPEPDAEAMRLSLSVRAAEEAALETALKAAAAQQGLGDFELGPGDAANPRVVLAPGASFGSSKCWPAESYAALADRLIAAGAEVMIVGGPGEEERVAAVKCAMASDALILDGCLDLGAFKALLSRTSLLVANDAGARHIAAAFSVPSVIFFGPTSVAKTADHLEAIEILETEHACRPCYARECPIDHRCLREIGVDDAVASADRALARGQGLLAERTEWT